MQTPVPSQDTTKFLDSHREDKVFRLMALSVWGLSFSLLLLMIFRGTPQVDEPMYLLKAREFLRGWPLIYRETPWSTPPLHMVIFSPFAAIAQFDLLLSRLFHLIFLIPGMVFAWKLFQLSWPRWGGLLAWSLVFCTPLMAYFLVLIKHHALEFSCIMPACYLLITQWKSPTIFLPTTMALACLIACVRAPYFAAPITLWIYFLLFYRKETKGIFVSIIVTLVVFGICLLPFTWGAFDQFKFGVWEMTAGYFKNEPMTFSKWFNGRVQYFFTLLKTYPPLVLPILFSILFLKNILPQPFSLKKLIQKHHPLLMVFIWPMSWTSPVLFTQNPQINWVLTLMTLWLIAACYVIYRKTTLKTTSPIYLGLFAGLLFAINGVLHFPFGLSRENSLGFIHPSITFINQHVKENEVFFSCQLFEGPQARGLPFPGSAGSIFGYRPDWKENSYKTKRFGVFTKEGLAKAMSSKKLKAIVLTSNYCPDFSQKPLKSLLKTHYKLSLQLPNYGQGQQSGSFYTPVPRDTPTK